MKMTLDLPDSLVKDIKIRALHEGRKLKDEMADLLRTGLAARGKNGKPVKQLRSPNVRTDAKTGLPVFACRKGASPSKMTIEQWLQLEQDAQTREDLERLGLSD